MKTWIVAAIVFALGATGLFWFATRDHGGANAAGGFQMPPPTVEVTAVESGPVVRTVEAVGTLRANEAVTIQPEIAGRIVDDWFRRRPTGAERGDAHRVGRFDLSGGSE